MPTPRFAFVLSFLAACGCALAQDPAATCDGTWSYSHVDKARGWNADVDVKITGETGTYFAHLGNHKSRGSPCRDREIPIEVRRCTPQVLVFRVEGEKYAPGCPSFTARVKRTGPDSGIAEIGRESDIEVHRKPGPGATPAAR